MMWKKFIKNRAALVICTIVIMMRCFDIMWLQGKYVAFAYLFRWVGGSLVVILVVEDEFAFRSKDAHFHRLLMKAFG